MTAAVAHLVEEALRLPSESRTELVEAILEKAAPSQEFLDEQMRQVRRRMEEVREGRSPLVPADEAHRKVREALAAGA